jgi:hypothetical protein
MDNYNGIFDPQLKINRLKSKYYLMHLEDIDFIKAKLKRTINRSPLLYRVKKKAKIVGNSSKIKDLEETYNFHKEHHPHCSVLPNIQSEIEKKRGKSFKDQLVLPVFKKTYKRPSFSVTPDPRKRLASNFILSPSKAQDLYAKLLI